MELPLQVTFRDMEPSAAVEERIRERADRLDRFHKHIMGCRVVVEAPHRHHHQGKLFHVRIDITVPGHELVVNRDPPQNHGHEDVYVAIRDAFDAAQRQLDTLSRKSRGEVKVHEEPSVAQVTRLMASEGYGFLTTPDGREIYFHKNSLLDGNFARLEVGTPVRFVEELGEKGPQASTVHVLG